MIDISTNSSTLFFTLQRHSLLLFYKVASLIVIFLSFSDLYAQKETFNWYFGEYAGLDFNGKTVKGIPNSKMSTMEGTASISDKNGKMLFYTNGETVWDKSNEIMLNGTGLMGTFSTTQSALIVPYPSNDSLYFLFTLGAQGDDFYYSLVNIYGNNGLGEVISKNTFLLDSCAEKLVAARHSNGKDFWIMVHTRLGEKFYAYFVNSSGLQPPIISQVGALVYSGGTEGCMKFSHDQKKIVTIYAFTNGIVELFDFDNTTGIVSNPILIYYGGLGNPELAYPYGVEFSPDNNLLYITWTETFGFPSGIDDVISQFDITLTSPSDIRNSKIDIHVFNYPGSTVSTGALQLGPDKRIYFLEYKKDYVGVIEYPNIRGLGCNPISKGVYLEGGKCRLGMPNLIPYLFECDSAQSVTTDTTLCFGLETKIGNYINDSIFYTWQDGSINPFYEVNSQGLYWVEKGKWGCSSRDTFNVSYYPEIKVEIGNDTSLCYGQKVDIDLNQPSASYIWQNGSTSSSFIIDEPGNYSVEVTKNDCKVKDSIRVDYSLCCKQLVFPNLVTLNQDGKNEELIISNLPQGYTTLEVYNAWGDRVFEDRKFDSNWKPEGVNEGIYYYVLKDNFSKETCKSWLHIIR